MTSNKLKLYCNSLTKYSRYVTREVFIGDIPLGGKNPIRIQSMTTTDTMDTAATVAQTIRMVNAGCEYVRITAPSKLEAQNLQEIKNELLKKGYKVPLIADIHFTPNAAEIAARIVEKVRVNPGNYADKKKFELKEYSDKAYNLELDRIREKFHPLVKICKEYGTAMRIGTNHGSLSDRIMSRYGDNPSGMVESALEFVHFCEELDYRDIVLSMKSSNPQVMVQAYRLLILRMQEEGMNYPLHLGVTEAGGGEDGRIKSAAGIGTLLEDGIGDTIRVSLTEDPEFEAPVAILLRDRYKDRDNHKYIPEIPETTNFDFLNYKRRETFPVENIGGNNVPVVVADYSEKEISPESLKAAGYTYNQNDDKWKISDSAADILYAGNNKIEFPLPSGLKAVYNYKKWLDDREGHPLLNAKQFTENEKPDSSLTLIELELNELNPDVILKLKNTTNCVVVLNTNNKHGMAEQRRAFLELVNNNIRVPVIIRREYGKLLNDEFMISPAADFGGLYIDGFGDGIWIKAELAADRTDGKYRRNFLKKKETGISVINRVSFGILQAVRVRISKTEYIACPSCGRTLFDLQETTEKIRKRTEHLKGVKIAIMGCIVNGPGEMADADYGYVGSGVDRITLYRGKDIVKRNIPSQNAVDILIDLIKEDNNWRDPVI